MSDRLVNKSLFCSLTDNHIMDMPIKFLSCNQQIRRHAILAHRRQMKSAATPTPTGLETPAERNKMYCKNWRAKQKQK